MSLMKTLAKVAIGVAAAKTVGSMVKKSQAGGINPGSGSVFGNAAQTQAPGGSLQDILGQMMGGAQGGSMQTRGQAQGGLGGLLDALGGAQGGAQSGGLDGLLGGLAQQMGGGAAAGGLGGLLGGLAQKSQAPAGQSPSFGEAFNRTVTRQAEPEVAPTADQEAAAALFLKAMIQAMKADGELDQAEQAKLMEKLGDVSAEEQAFVQHELQSPMDVNELVRETPQGMQAHVYAMSVMAIDLDSQAEAKYLDSLARGLGLNQQTVNSLHQQLGVPSLYA